MLIPRVYRWLFPFLLCSAAVRAQTTSAIPEPVGFSFRSIDFRNGLFGDDVFSISQDETGFIWIGGRRGLQRYDGFRFVSYIDTAGVNGEAGFATTILPDSKNNRILYNYFPRHLMERNTFTGRASRLEPETRLDLKKARIFTGGDGRQWLFQEYIQSKVSAGGKIREGLAIIRDPEKDKPFFTAFSEDLSTGFTWITEEKNGLVKFDNRSGKIQRPSTDPDNNPLFELVKDHPGVVRNIRLDSYGNVWMIGWGDALYRYEQGTGKLHTYSLSSVIKDQHNLTVFNGWVNDVLQDNHGRIWLATAHAGLLAYLPALDQFTYTLSGVGESSLRYNLEINNLYQDRDENIWVGTDRGVSVFNPYRQNFNAISEDRKRGDLSLRYEVNSLLAHSNGDLLLALHGGGISVFDSSGTFRRQLQFSGNDERLVWSMIERPGGEIWVGCQHGVLQVLDANYKLVRKTRPEELMGSTVRCMASDGKGNMFFGLHNGSIVVWNKLSDTYTVSSQALPGGMPQAPPLNIFFDKPGRCWVGTGAGLAEFDPSSYRYKAFYKPIVNTPTACYGMAGMNDSTLVLGMDNAGLVYFNTRSETFTRLPLQPDGMPWSVHAVTLDTSGAIWFTTDFNVCRYNPVTKELTINSPDNGLMNSSFNSPLFVKTGNGRFASTTRTEAISFFPAKLTANNPVPDAVRITGLRVFDQRKMIDSLLHLRLPVKLDYRDNFISIEFSDLRFSGSLKTRYFYRLSGIDQAWVDAGSRSVAGYTNLPPGEYRFMVTSGSPSNVNGMGIIDFVIVPPFWQTTWFRVLVILFAIGAIASVAWWYIARIRRESDMKRQIATTEMMALRAQMNPHFIFNCINSIDAMIQQDDKYNATIYLNKFAKLIRNILDSSRQQTISFRKDLEALQLYVELEQFRSGNSFTAEITTDERIAQNDIKVPPLIIQPYVENAILHGLKNRESTDGKLKIDIFTEGDQLVYVIEDNGVGRAASVSSARKHRSYGMEITGDRLRLFNNKEEVAPVLVTDLVENGQATGTRVQVSLKIKYA